MDSAQTKTNGNYRGSFKPTRGGAFNRGGYHSTTQTVATNGVEEAPNGNRSFRGRGNNLFRGSSHRGRGTWNRGGRGRGRGGHNGGQHYGDDSDGLLAPHGIEISVWGKLNDQLKMKIIDHVSSLDEASEQAKYIEDEEIDQHPNQRKSGDEKCFKCETFDPENGSRCMYSRCDRYMCGNCTQKLPMRQQGGKTIKSDGSVEVSSPTPPGDEGGYALLCSKCKPKVAYCRRCLLLNEARALVFCYSCKRKVCSCCENVVLGRRGSRDHYHQCKACVVRDPVNMKRWAEGDLSPHQPCRISTCQVGDSFVDLTEEEDAFVQAAIAESQKPEKR